MIQVTNSQGITFNVRLVRNGDNYGRNDLLIHNGLEPMVEFYDLRFTHGFGERGQFVSRYYVSTILKVRSGITLEGGVSEWSISAKNTEEVIQWLNQELSGGIENGN